MSKGKVKWFSPSKGYGFITDIETNKDVFTHFSSINMTGYKTLVEGEEVTYDLAEGVKGPQAANVVRLNYKEKKDEVK